MSLGMSIRHWAPYLRIAKFTAVVDHHALVFLITKTAKTNNGRIIHWISDLLEFLFDVVHRAGKLHLDADAVLRLLNNNDMGTEFAVDRHDIPNMDSCSPATAFDLKDMQRQYYELILQFTENYEQYRSMMNNPDYYRLINSKDFLMSRPRDTDFLNFKTPITNTLQHNQTHHHENQHNQSIR